jgi:hypothetical protein
MLCGISDFLFMFVMFQGKVVIIRGEGPKGGPGKQSVTRYSNRGTE